MPTVSTTLTVSFRPSDAASGANGRLSAEVDSRPDGLNGGKTSFSPGDAVGFLVYASEGVSITNIVASLGAIGSKGATTVAITEFLTFAKAKEATLRAPVGAGGVNAFWVGNDGGEFTIVNGVVSIPVEAVAVLYANYSATAHGYMLTNIPAEVAGLTEFEVLVYIEGEYPG